MRDVSKAINKGGTGKWKGNFASSIGTSMPATTTGTVPVTQPPVVAHTHKEEDGHQDLTDEDAVIAPPRPNERKDSEQTSSITEDRQDSDRRLQSQASSHDDANYDYALDHGSEEDHEGVDVTDDDIGDDALADAHLTSVLQNVNETVNKELDVDDDEDNDNERCPDEGKEVTGDDGVVRVVDKTGVLLPKLCYENLAIFNGTEVASKSASHSDDDSGLVALDSEPGASRDKSRWGNRNQVGQHSSRNAENETNSNDVQNNSNDMQTSSDNWQKSMSKQSANDMDGERSSSQSNGLATVQSSGAMPLPNAVQPSDKLEAKDSLVPSRQQGPTKDFPNTLLPSATRAQNQAGSPTTQQNNFIRGMSTDTEESEDGVGGDPQNQFLGRIGGEGNLPPIKETKEAKVKLPEHEKQHDFPHQDSKGNSSRGKSRLINRNVNLCRLLFASNKDDDEKQIASLVFRVIGSVLILCALYLGNFFVTFEVMQQGSYTGSEVNNAERRVFLTSELVTLSQELLIGDGEVFSTLNRTRDELISAMSLLRQVHDGLRFGDESLNLPGSDGSSGKLDSTLYDREGTSFNVTLDSYEDTLFSQGVEVGLRFLLQTVEIIVGRYGDSKKMPEFQHPQPPNFPRPGRNLTALDAEEDFNFIVNLDRQHLRPGLASASSEFLDIGSSRLDTLEVYEILLFIADLLLYMILWITVYRTMTKELVEEGQRSEDVLLLIPPEIVEKTKGLHVFFRNSGGVLGGGQ